MANSNALSVIRLRVLKELGLGFEIENAALGTIAATSVISTKYFQNSRHGPDHWSSQNYVIFRPTAATAADYERLAGAVTVASGTLAHTGANWSDTTAGTETFEMWRLGIRPATDVFDSINRALGKLFYSTFVPLSELSSGSNDGDNAASATTAYTSVGSPTLSKVTTAVRTPYGLRSLRSLSSGTDEGVQTPTILARQDRSIRYGVISSADVGGVTYNAYDVTASANFSSLEALTHSEEEPQLVWSPWGTIPDDCKGVAIQGLGTTTTSDVYHNMFWLYRMGNRRIDFPAYVTEAYEVPSVFQMVPLYGGGTSNVYDALAMDFVPLKEGVDFRYIINQRDANPTGILLLHDSCTDYPLMTQARQAYPALTSETDTTACPLKEIVPLAKIELLDSLLIPTYPTDIRWRELRQKSLDELKTATSSRKFTPVAGSLPFYNPRRVG